MNRLKGKVAIITGAAGGLGEADARLFAQEGAQVILADINVGEGERIAREIGPQTTFMRLDVRNEGEWQQLIAAVMLRYGRLDILVNNAGVSALNTPENVTDEEYRFIMAVSVDGTVFGCKHAIPAMKVSGGGSIINMSSVAAVTGEYYCAAYCAAKGAVAAYTRAVAVYCTQNQLKIRCNSLQPAALETSMAHLIDEPSTKSPAQGVPTALKNPFGRADDCAYLALYLASDESSFVSGQSIVIDNTSTITMGQVPVSGPLAEQKIAS